MCSLVDFFFFFFFFFFVKGMNRETKHLTGSEFNHVMNLLIIMVYPKLLHLHLHLLLLLLEGTHRFLILFFSFSSSSSSFSSSSSQRQGRELFGRLRMLPNVEEEMEKEKKNTSRSSSSSSSSRSKPRIVWVSTDNPTTITPTTIPPLEDGNNLSWSTEFLVNEQELRKRMESASTNVIVAGVS